MSRKTILALAAAAALGAAALAPTSASAFGHFGGGGGGHAMSMSRGPVGHTMSFNRGSINRGPVNRGPVIHSVGRGPNFHRPGPGNHLAYGPHHLHYPYHHHHHCFHHHCGPHFGWWWWRHYHRPYWVYPVVGETEVETVAAQPSYVAPAPVARDNCNCLTKSYLADGSVMFKDLCTKEAAVATPDELKAQAAGVAPGTQSK